MQSVRVLAAVIGGLLVVVTGGSVVRVLIVPRAGGARRYLFSPVIRTGYGLILRRCRSYEHRDRVLASRAAALLIAQLAAWLAEFYVGFALLLWPQLGGLGAAFRESGSSMLTLGYLSPHGSGATALSVLAAITGLVVVALQIAYLPTLYAAFNRRETLVALLLSRAGLPPWGPELLVRTRYGIDEERDDLPAFYAAWELWAADVAESHSNYPILVEFRSPAPYASWLVGLLAVMDSAALLLAVAPARDRIEPRLCLRMGFTALRQIADALRIPYDPEADFRSDLQLSFEEFHAGYQRLVDVGFGVERTAEEAWPHFRGWRINYEGIAYELARRTDAVPALWSGPRRWEAEPIPPQRPPNRRPDRDDAAPTSPGQRRGGRVS